MVFDHFCHGPFYIAGHIAANDHIHVHRHRWPHPSFDLTYTAPLHFIPRQEAGKIDARIGEKTDAALDAVIDKQNELMTEGVNIVGDKVDAADTFKYDKIGEVTGKYYCSPGYSTATARRRALLQQASQCKPCGEDYYCAGGFQTLDDPNRAACPEPTAGSRVLDFTTDGLTTASSRDQCLAVCAAGYYAADNVYGPCEICGYGFYCIGGVQRSLFQDRVSCDTVSPGTNTTEPNASSPDDCVA
jgi:hypothetical protein